MAWLNMVILVYLLLVNMTAVCLTVYDKKAAKKHRRRISENGLMLTALLGGGIGMYLTMLLIRHKTKHPKFMVGIPVIILLEAGLLGVLIYYYHGGTV